MALNGDIADLFEQMAKLLELNDENRFKVNAYVKVARILRELPTDVAALSEDKGKLMAIDGIGEGTASKIIEYAKTSRIKEYDALAESVPPGVLEIMQIPNVGPKTAAKLWKNAGITDVATLRAKATAGALDDLPGLGAKSVKRILESLAFAEKSGERMRLGEALPIAEAIVERLRAVKGAKRIEYAGSLRRGAETIGDIDILASGDAEALAKSFQTMPEVQQVIASGETKISVRLAQGVQCDLRLIPDASFGAAWMYFTGSKAHNIILRERAIKMGMRLNEYGLFPDITNEKGEDEPAPHKRGIKPKASKTEEEIYKLLKLPWTPPELREDRGEIGATIPDLIELEDIRAELHAHTTASDGVWSIDDLARAAKARGFHTVAITDHSRSQVQARGLTVDRLKKHIEAIREADERIKGITILAGSEVDILADGRLDYEDEVLALLDVVVASPHAALTQKPDVVTERLLKAIRHPLVHIIGHPTGRLIGRREGLSPDIPALAHAAAEHNTALEINANSWRLDLRDTHARIAHEAGALIAINTDAHGPADMEQLRYGILTARRGWLTADRCINTWTAKRLHAWLKAKR